MDIGDKQYANGRISGSASWKVSRNVDGSSNSNNNNEETETNGTYISSSSSSFYGELFHLIHQIREKDTILSIHANANPSTRHGGIVVSGSLCAMTSLNDSREFEGISIVALDFVYLGCILQSICFIYLQGLPHFITTKPKNRIIFMTG